MKSLYYCNSGSTLVDSLGISNLVKIFRWHVTVICHMSLASSSESSLTLPLSCLPTPPSTMVMMATPNTLVSTRSYTSSSLLPPFSEYYLKQTGPNDMSFGLRLATVRFGTFGTMSEPEPKHDVQGLVWLNHWTRTWMEVQVQWFSWTWTLCSNPEHFVMTMGKHTHWQVVKLRKSGPWKIPECGAELHWGAADRFSGPRKMLQCRVRAWLQLMGCALVLELGVLISERVKDVTVRSVTE